MKKPATSLESLEPFFNRIAKLSRLQRVILCSAAFVFIIGGFFYFGFLPKFQTIGELKEELEQLEQKLVAMRAKAGELETYRAKLAETESRFQIVRKALPEQKDIPQLLESVSLSGQEAGLEFLLFEPKPEKNQDFYSVIPVDIRIEGSYRNVEDFLDRVSRLSRIVNISNIRMKPRKEENLDTQCTALTYRFIESQGQKEEKKEP